MIKCLVALIVAGLAIAASAAEIHFDFSKCAVGETPSGFSSRVTGRGKPAKWTVAEEAVPPLLAPIESNAVVNTAKHPVLTVQSFDMEDAHCPVLLYTNEFFSDFTLTTRFKITGGIVDPCAGVVFRAQNQSNYYVVRASAEGNLLWYRVVDGQSYENLGIGVKMPMPKDTWRELRIECFGSQTRCYVDGKLAIPPAMPGAPTNDLAINDTTFSQGMVGFWSKADSQCLFTDARVTYAPRVPYVQVVVNNIIRKYPKLLGLQIYANKNAAMPVVVGCMNEKDFGAKGTKTEADVLAKGSIYILKDHGNVEVTMPLRDRNGDVAAALKVKMKSFHGETESNAIARALIVKKAIEEQINTLENING